MPSGHARAEAPTQLLSASPHRVEPICRHFTHMRRLCPPAYGARRLSRAGSARRVVDMPGAPTRHRGKRRSGRTYRPNACRRRRAVFAAVNTAQGELYSAFIKRGSAPYRRHSANVRFWCQAIVDQAGAPSLMLPTSASGSPADRRGSRCSLPTMASIFRFKGAGKIERPVTPREPRRARMPTASLARLTVDGSEIFLNRRPEIQVDGHSNAPAGGRRLYPG